jgi:O-antigen biosynthesis protein
VFNYSTYYPLAEAIQLVGRGVVLFDYHGVTPPELWDGPGVEDLIRGQQQLGLVRYADYAIAHSSYTRTELVASGGISPDRVDVIPYVVPLGSFRPGPRDAELVERYRLEGKVVLLYIGRMAGNKRIIDLVRALPPVAAEHPGATLLLVGDASTPAYTKVVADARAEAARLGVAEQVIFTGPVAHTELHRYYRTCDIYVTSSLHEGFCIPVVEAMACGVPVVGTRAAALPETIGDAGLIAEPQNPSDLAQKVLQLLGKLLSSEKGGVREDYHSRTAHPLFGNRGS